MKRKLKEWLLDDFIRHTGIVAVGSAVINVINLGYHLALVRLLSVVEYGVANAMVSLIVLALQLRSVLNPSLAKSFAEAVARDDAEHVRSLARRSARDTAWIGSFCLVLFACLSGPLARYQQIDQPMYIVFVGLFLAVSFASIMPEAFLWGTQRFALLVALGAVGAVIRLLLGTGLVLAGAGVTGALLAYVAGAAVVLVVGYALVRRVQAHTGGTADAAPVSMRPIYVYGIPTLAAFLSFWALVSLDVVLVKHYFSPVEAGHYCVAQMDGKIVLFLPGAIAMVVFPKAASARVSNTDSSRYLKKGLLIALAINVVAVTVCTTMPHLVLTVLTGKTAAESLRLVPWFAVAMSIYALNWVVISYRLSIHDTRFVPVLLVVAVAQVLTIMFYHPTLAHVLYIMSGYSVVLFVALLLAGARRKGASGA